MLCGAASNVTRAQMLLLKGLGIPAKQPLVAPLNVCLQAQIRPAKFQET